MNGFKYISDEPSITWINDSLLNQRIDSSFYLPKYIINEEVLKNSGLSLKNLEHVTKWVKKGIFDMPARLYSKVRENHIPFIRISNIKDLEFDTTDLVYIPIDSHKKEIKTELFRGDIVISKVGTIGNIGIINEELSPCNFSQNNIGIKMNGKIDSHYLAVYMLSKYCILQLNRHSTIQVQAKLNLSDIRDLIVPVPSQEIQKYIGDKIRRVEELRDEAKKLRDEAEEYINKKLGFLNLDEDKQYSSAFIPSNKIIDRIDSEYYNIRYLNIEEEFEKRGYKVKTLDELCTRIYNGKTYSTSIKESKYINIGVGELGDWFINKNSEKFINDTINKKYCLKKNSIIWGNAAHLAKYIGEKVNMIFEDDVIIPTTEVTAIEPNEEVIDPYYLFLFMRSQWGYYQIQRTVKGMTAHSYPQDIERILVPIIELTTEEKEKLKNYVVKSFTNEVLAKQLIQKAKQDVEDLIEGKFDMSKLNETTTESR